jgi:DNA gyrase/topoisomerase IV subunit B
MIEKNFIELVDIESIEYTDRYENMVDISVDIDETFTLSNGIVSHNSARNFAVAGFSVTGRDNFGCFPIRGKSLNVRGLPMQKIRDNEELKNIIQILGLEFGKKYKDLSELRYGKLVLTTDSDTDGYHIKGLLINFFEVFFTE